MKRIARWWQARQRAIDLQTLWPSCKQAAFGDVALARRIFLFHALQDSPWVVLGEAEIHRIVGDLR